jgi:hypothetical protein
MGSPLTCRFPHRHNQDGSHDSICISCYATAASAQTESDLAQLESDHVCDPLFRQYVSQSRPEIGPQSSKIVA